MYSISLCCVLLTFFVIVTSENSSTSSLRSNDDGTYCDGDGWIAYLDEKCYKLIKQWASRDQAKAMCAQEEPQADGSIPQLATIKSSDEQTYLTELVFNKSAVAFNVWIGLKRHDGNKFIWDDNSDVEFTNWAEGNPTESIQQNCAVMKPEYMRSNSQGTTVGHWRDVPCEMPNYVICEKLPRWSTTKLQKTLLETRKKLKDSNDLQSQELDVAIEETKNKLIPIGFLYTQLPYGKAPSEIWPWMTWTDASPAYAGVFFRVEGGGAATFGQVQNENSPRLTEVYNQMSWENSQAISTPVGGWSPYVVSGWVSDREFLRLKFHQSGGEVRPRNMAIRVWRRTG